jgi:16S rRNA (uracil1498-N3)-methyltransferase
MSKTRLFSPIRLTAGTEMRLGDDQSRYVGKVLRQKPGDALTLFDGHGGEFRTTIAAIDRKGVDVVVEEHRDTDVESSLVIHLLQGVSRGERMDFVVQKATELGVSRITPVITEFSVVKLDKSRAARRQEHWSKIIVSACEQCGRNVLPHIDAPLSLRNWFGENLHASGSKLVLVPGSAGGLATLAASESQVTILVGPEGGFSDAEYEQAAAAGFSAAGLGPRTLRTETAALAAIAALQTLYGDLAR